MGLRGGTGVERQQTGKRAFGSPRTERDQCFAGRCPRSGPPHHESRERFALVGEARASEELGIALFDAQPLAWANFTQARSLPPPWLSTKGGCASQQGSLGVRSSSRLLARILQPYLNA
jgi:hypothetical protein